MGDTKQTIKALVKPSKVGKGLSVFGKGNKNLNKRIKKWLQQNRIPLK